MKSMLLEFQGVIGAIFGSVSTLFATHVLENIGKVKFNLIDYAIDLFKEGEMGEHVKSNIEEAETANINISAEIYNPSNIIKTINNISIKLLDDKKRILTENVAKDRSTYRISAARHHYDDFIFINCESKRLLRKELKVFINPTILRKTKYLRVSYVLLGRKIMSKKHMTVLINNN